MMMSLIAAGAVLTLFGVVVITFGTAFLLIVSDERRYADEGSEDE